ncbi:hypothetical protein SLS60_005585 [Paraconiothyrium brasiliense]|uniref:DUF7730 domain-containing protein n=1 Tax=Paraconiothyrium brasiliense TaxID=300254 RepID=A0ABR3RI69_9PLEO
MAPVSPTVARKSSKARAVGDTGARVTKQKSMKQARKPKNGLLDASIPRNATHLMELEDISAQRNSTQSPLLRLPPEIRNKIWEYAIGGFNIKVFRTRSCEHLKELSYYADDLSEKLSRPTFHLHKVCRQAYVETAPLIYTLNTFGFYKVSAMDRWIKLRPIGQLQLITSIEVPFSYFSLYIQGLRTKFRKRFPNLKRIGLDEYGATHATKKDETVQESKPAIANILKEREGDDVEVEWYVRSGQTNMSEFKTDRYCHL